MEESPRARHRVPELTSHKLAVFEFALIKNCKVTVELRSYIQGRNNCAQSLSIKGSSATASENTANIWYSLIMRRLMGKLI